MRMSNGWLGSERADVGAAMALEREHLLPLAKEGFDLAAVSVSDGERRAAA